MEAVEQMDIAQTSSLPRTALVVEDNAALCEVIVSLLETCNLQVTATGDGIEARDLLLRQEYGVIVCDLDLPGMSGDQLFAVCRDERPHLADRFVFITGGWHLRNEAFLPDTGQPYLLKPFNCSMLVQLVTDTITGG